MSTLCPGAICLGGAFNPIHFGHLLCARAAAQALGIQTVVLIPTGRPSQKALDASMASAEDRLRMCRLAVADLPGWQVNDIELNRPGPSYTLETVRELRRQGWPVVPWLLGADQIQALPTWHQPLALLAEAHLIPMARPGWTLDWSKLPSDYRVLAERVVTVPILEISSTLIRRRVAGDKPIDFLTPPAVCQYIQERGLYRP